MADIASRIRHLLAQGNLIFPGPMTAMCICRTILALVIAVSVAVLPAAGHASVSVKSAEVADMAGMDDMPCCPHKTHSSDKAIDGCASMVGCILCAGFLGPASSDTFSPMVLTSLAISFASNPFHSQTGSPPFRPPRV